MIREQGSASRPQLLDMQMFQIFRLLVIRVDRYECFTKIDLLKSITSGDTVGLTGEPYKPVPRAGYQTRRKVAVLVMAKSAVQTAGQTASCLRQLAPCLGYLNGTKEVPEICCDPLKSVIRKDPECLCRMISNRGSSQAERAGIDVNEAQMLPARCGEHVNPLACLTGAKRSRNSDQSSSSAGLFMGFYCIIAAAISSFVLQIC
ncbi:PREDICTED: lipid transfer-like protein VAS [Tarenaya hassleriana]|uniref:lipid transfer-like protein VAS n=1 Tax=Tarenaya hassleriana TaxID=28532 RepID=UPI00053C3BA8|nr:PREDICTED: lipid transfer-like protein VAS [Tarenaya hassleriana]